MITMASVVIYGLTLNESVGFFTQMKPWRGGWEARFVANSIGDRWRGVFAGSDSPWGEG